MNAQNPLFKRLATLSHLPSLPHTLFKLIEACNLDNPDLKGMGDIVSKDHALSAKILKLVNFAYFGLFRIVEAISEAAVLVGTSAQPYVDGTLPAMRKVPGLNGLQRGLDTAMDLD